MFWDIAPCSSVKVNRRFGGTSPRRMLSEVRSENGSACSLLQAGLLLSSKHPKDGEDMFLRKRRFTFTGLTDIVQQKLGIFDIA
jgi:hypothetical protein